MPDGRRDVAGAPCRHHVGWLMLLPQLEAGTFLHLEDVRALLPFGSAITVHGPTKARAHLSDLATNLAHHYAP